MKDEIGRWLDTAVSGIRFGPDRREARAELAAHIEDKTESLRRRFPDIPPEEAEQRALEGMGDPQELKTQLAKVHKAWLGYLWSISRRVVVLGVVLSLISLPLGLSRSWYRPNNRMADTYAEYTLELTPDNSRISLDRCTLSMTEAKGKPGAGSISGLNARLRLAGPCFWALNGQGLYEHMEAEDSLGNRYVQIDEQFHMEEKPSPFRFVSGNANGRGPFHRDYDLRVANIHPEAEWVRLEYRWLGREFSMTVELKEAGA